jgi:hypothetical protein
LSSSDFTHHLATALRGAGDADGDGRVSLDEAYRYAYRRTLVSTARTQVGEQHVTLEMDLAGQGEVPMTFPAEAKSHLELPGPLDARVIVTHRTSGAVVAELQKAPGPPLRLAFMAGPYEAIVRQKSGILQCRFALSDDNVTPLDTSGCTPVAPDRTAAKGEAQEREPGEADRWEVEGAMGFIWGQSDDFTNRLQEFGYQQQHSLIELPRARLSLGASRTLVKHIAGVAQVMTLAGDSYERSIAGSSDTASFSAYGGAVYVRAFTDVLDPWLGIYGQAGAGMSLGTLTYKTQQTGVPPSTTDTYFSYLLSGAVGMTARFPHYLTLFLQAGYDRAPAIYNRIGDTHDSGGLSAVLGVRLRFGDDRW